MSPGEWTGLGTLTLTALSLAVTAIWKWSKAVEDRAYERVRNEALLREAQATISQKDSELQTKDQQLATVTDELQLTEAELRHEREVEQPRLHRQIESQAATITWFTAEGAS